jgi:hypothetical protein
MTPTNPCVQPPNTTVQGAAEARQRRLHHPHLVLPAMKIPRDFRETVLFKEVVSKFPGEATGAVVARWYFFDRKNPGVVRCRLAPGRPDREPGPYPVGFLDYLFFLKKPTYLHVCSSDIYVVMYCICGHYNIFCYLICIVCVDGVYVHIRPLLLHTLVGSSVYIWRL